jgi:hypothetical protein
MLALGVIKMHLMIRFKAVCMKGKKCVDNLKSAEEGFSTQTEVSMIHCRVHVSPPRVPVCC